MGKRKDLGDVLVSKNLISVDQLAEAKAQARETGEKFVGILVELGYIEEEKLVEFLSQHYGLQAVDLDHFDVDDEALRLVSRDVCKKHGVLPVSKAGNTLVVAFSDPGNIFVKDDLQFVTRCKIEVVIASERAIREAIERYYTGETGLGSLVKEMGTGEDVNAEGGEAEVGFVDAQNMDDDAPVVKFVNAMISDAIRQGVSDIHIEPYEKRFRVRFRIDGRLIEKSQPPAKLANTITSRIKVMSKMNIAEKRRPQDARLKVRMTDGREIDFRVSSLPTLFGEKIVLRVLDKSNLQVDMTKLGFESKDLEVFKEVIYRPQGMLLITGPTGSGKTTTIYSGLAELNRPDINISTAEDPVEFNIDGINQVQVNPEIDFTFSSALRTFLRQDPDVIMVGEIRDLETAEIAFKAASTGHLVVSTLHTNGAPETISRLIDMGVKPYMINSTISLIIAQRLIARNCSRCSEPISVPPQVLIELGVREDEVGEYKLMKGQGCTKCNRTGLKGRIAIFETLMLTNKIKKVLVNDYSPMALKQACLESGMTTLRGSALLKLKEGLTTIEQVVTASVRED